MPIKYTLSIGDLAALLVCVCTWKHWMIVAYTASRCHIGELFQIHFKYSNRFEIILAVYLHEITRRAPARLIERGAQLCAHQGSMHPVRPLVVSQTYNPYSWMTSQNSSNSAGWIGACWSISAFWSSSICLRYQERTYWQNVSSLLHNSANVPIQVIWL